MANETIIAALNETVNATVNAVNTAANAAANSAANAAGAGNQTTIAKIGAGASYFFNDMLLPRFIEILKAPLVHKGMLWMTIPLVATMLLLMYYFSRFKKEELGWNTAVGNSLILIFVGMDLLRNLAAAGAFTLASLTSLTSNIKILVALFIIAEGILLFMADFVHALPKRFAFFISSPIYINLTAYMGLVLVYSDVPIDIITILAAVMLYAFFLLIFFIMRKVIPENAKEIEEEDEDENRHARKPKPGQKKGGGEKGWVEIKARDEDSESASKGMLSDIKKDRDKKKEKIKVEEV